MIIHFQTRSLVPWRISQCSISKQHKVERGKLMRLLLILIYMKDSSTYSLKTDIMQLFWIVSIIYLPYKLMMLRVQVFWLTKVLSVQQVSLEMSSLQQILPQFPLLFVMMSKIKIKAQDLLEAFALTAKSWTVNTFALIATNLYAPFAVMVFEIYRTFGVVVLAFLCTALMFRN